MVSAGVGVAGRALSAGPAMARHLRCVDRGEANTCRPTAKRISVDDFQTRAVDSFVGINSRKVNGRHARRNSDGSAPAHSREAEQRTDEHAHYDETDGGTQSVWARSLTRGCLPQQMTPPRRTPAHHAPKVELIPHTLPIPERFRRNKPVPRRSFQIRCSGEAQSKSASARAQIPPVNPYFHPSSYGGW